MIRQAKFTLDRTRIMKGTKSPTRFGYGCMPSPCTVLSLRMRSGGNNR